MNCGFGSLIYFLEICGLAGSKYLLDLSGVSLNYYHTTQIQTGTLLCTVF